MRAPRGGRLSGSALAGMAATGLLLGHLITYVLIRPDAHARAAMLARTGHGYFSTALEAGVLLAVAGCASLVMRVAQARRAGVGDAAVMRLVGVIWRLAVLQCAAFAAMEVGERLAAAAPVSGVVAGHLLLVGLAVQVLVAAVGGVALRWLTRAAEWIGVRLRRPRRRVPATWPAPPRVAFGSRLAALGAARVRAPPPPLVVA